MRVVAVYSWARDVTGAVVLADGTVDWRRGRMAPGEDDHAAIAVAQAVAGDAGAVVGLTVGDADPSWALARGVGEALRVTDVPPFVDDGATAAALAAGVRHLAGEAPVDVVVIGDAEEHPGVGVTLAAHLGLPVLAGVVAAAAADGRVEVTRRVDGVDERVSAPVPVVLVVAAQAAEAKAPGMKELLAARKRQVSTISAAELGIDLADAVTTEARRRPELTGAELFTGDPTEAARQLLAALRSEGVL